MKIKIKDKNYDLDLSLPELDKLKVVNDIFQEKVTYRGSEMTIEEFLTSTYNNSKESQKSCDMIGYYLTKNDSKDGVLSRNSMQEMINGSKDKANPFSESQELKLGIIGD